MLPISLLAFLFFSLTLSSPADVLYIKKLIADESQLLDAKDFAGLVNIFAPNATYGGGDPSTDVHGIKDIQAALAMAVPQDLVTQFSTGTESITLLAPFDEQGAAGTATGVVYLTVTNFGAEELANQTLLVLAKYTDKYVKSGNSALYGGWRISDRQIFELGSIGDREAFLRHRP